MEAELFIYKDDFINMGDHNTYRKKSKTIMVARQLKHSNIVLLNNYDSATGSAHIS